MMNVSHFSKLSKVLALSIAMVCVAPALSGVRSAIASVSDPEALIRSAYIYNFTKFVEWPGNTNPMELCAISPNQIGEALKVIENESTSDRVYKVLAQAKDAVAPECHVVYIDTNVRQVGALATALNKRPVLTVGEGHKFVDEGGMVAFVKADNKIKLAVNVKAAESVGLKMDPQLLEIAVRVVK